VVGRVEFCLGNDQLGALGGFFAACVTWIANELQMMVHILHITGPLAGRCPPNFFLQVRDGSNSYLVALFACVHLVRLVT